MPRNQENCGITRSCCPFPALHFHVHFPVVQLGQKNAGITEKGLSSFPDGFELLLGMNFGIWRGWRQEIHVIIRGAEKDGAAGEYREASPWNGNPTPRDPPGAAEGFSSVLAFPCSPGKQPRFPGNSMSLSQEAFPEGPHLPCPDFP